MAQQQQQNVQNELAEDELQLSAATELLKNQAKPNEQLAANVKVRQ